ncbi:MAG: AI-2E family transporter [Candidatus Dojkabacteria bacterium]
MNEYRIEIKPKIVLWTIGIISAFFIIILLRNVIVLFFISFLLSAGMRPVVDKLETQRIPRLVSLLILYLIIFLFVLLVLYLTLDTFISQFNSFIDNLPTYVENILSSVNEKIPAEWGLVDQSTIQDAVASVRSAIQSADTNTLQDIFNFISANLESVTSTGISVISGVTNFLFTGFLVLMIAAYLIVRDKDVFEGVIDYIPLENRKKFREVYDRVEKSLGEWVVGQLALMIFIGLITYLVLVIPGIFNIDTYELHKYALLLALIAGLLELFPNIGPTVTFFITALLALATGGSFGVLIYVVVTSLAIQQGEALFVVPVVMKRAVDLDPIITILAIIAGLQLGGVLGAILSIPVFVVSRIIFEEIKADSEKRSLNISKNTNSGSRKIWQTMKTWIKSQ